MFLIAYICMRVVNDCELSFWGDDLFLFFVMFVFPFVNLFCVSFVVCCLVFSSCVYMSIHSVTGCVCVCCCLRVLWLCYVIVHL